MVAKALQSRMPWALTRQPYFPRPNEKPDTQLDDVEFDCLIKKYLAEKTGRASALVGTAVEMCRQTTILTAALAQPFVLLPMSAQLLFFLPYGTIARVPA